MTLDNYSILIYELGSILEFFRRLVLGQKFKKIEINRIGTLIVK